MSEQVGAGGKINVEGYSRHLYALFAPGAHTGLSATALKVIQRAAGANMSVDVQQGNGFIDISTSYLYPAWVATSDKNVSVDAADPTNPRKDIVVAYIDLASITTSLTNNTGALKFKAVAGTPAGSPADPSAGTIQAAVGSGNPYIAIARLAVTAADTSIVTADITDLRQPVSVRAPLKKPYATAKTAAYTLTPGDAGGVVPFDCTAGALTATLPDATLFTGISFVISKSDTSANKVTIATTSSQTINGAATSVLKLGIPNERIEVISDGTNWKLVTAPTISFEVYRNAAQNGGAANTDAKVAHDAEVFDSSDCYDAVTNNRFTAPIPGVYHFDAGSYWQANPGGRNGIKLYKNGSQVKFSEWSSALQFGGPNIAADLKLAAGDYVEVFVLSTSATVALTVGSALFNWFNGHLVK